MLIISWALMHVVYYFNALSDGGKPKLHLLEWIAACGKREVNFGVLSPIKTALFPKAGEEVTN
ncbi:MAG UNVERIFIED_CONTAM: hypothetical protein LVR18_42500 [Planctomycetaceae bacterium]